MGLFKRLSSPTLSNTINTSILLSIFFIACTQQSKLSKNDDSGSSCVLDSQNKESNIEIIGDLTWIVDDYDKALACSKKNNKPILIDFWAPWCHTCLSMKQHIFTQKNKFNTIKDEFIFLALDTDKPQNNTNHFIKNQIDNLQAWPTFFIIDKNQNIKHKHEGSMSAQAFIDFATITKENGKEHGKGHVGLTHYYKTCKALIKNAFITNSFLSKQLEKKSNQFKLIDAMYYAKECLNDFSTTVSTTNNKQWLAAYNNFLLQKTNDSTFINNITLDDKSEFYRLLRHSLILEGKIKQAKILAKTHETFLKTDMSKSIINKDYKNAMTFGYPLIEVSEFNQTLTQNIALLKAIASALPNEYDPSYRLAAALYKINEFKNAYHWIKQSQKNVYGPRTHRILQLKASIEKELNLVQEEITTRQSLVTLYRSLYASSKKESYKQYQQDNQIRVNTLLHK